MYDLGGHCTESRLMHAGTTKDKAGKQSKQLSSSCLRRIQIGQVGVPDLI
jgi:hypothetical protein